MGNWVFQKDYLYWLSKSDKCVPFLHFLLHSGISPLQNFALVTTLMIFLTIGMWNLDCNAGGNQLISRFLSALMVYVPWDFMKIFKRLLENWETYILNFYITVLHHYTKKTKKDTHWTLIIIFHLFLWRDIITFSGMCKGIFRYRLDCLLGSYLILIPLRLRYPLFVLSPSSWCHVS